MSTSPVERDTPGEVIAGFVATAAIAVGAIALAVRPLPLAVASLLLSLLAVGMAGPRFARLAAVSVAVASLSFILAMTIAVLTGRPLY